MFDVIIDAINYLVENFADNATVRWLSLLVVAVVLSIIVTNKLTIFINKLEISRVKQLKNQIVSLERQLATCRDKIQELHNKNAALLAKFQNVENEDDEDPCP